ncbi:hypothetical protein [Natrialba sp. SSL1]|uniref:hypothetical protein n=1 Tax=Natrialba sp. SSL1 TaxID=1869245 RepID=UPI0008F7F8A7|nr:hypothetical protein [Natrialba sp. SSL1]OIB58947.1 hypothetical protein BBD46_05420 [Natrialba sp. SSL1]
MKVNRRTTLIGLGTIVAGGGAALGTGAFDTVEADRSVDIETTGDGGALLGLEILSDTLAGDGEADEDVIEFDLDNLNADATTTFEDALEITNNGTEPVTVTIEDESEENLIGDVDKAMSFTRDSSDSAIDLGTEDDEDEHQATLAVEFDLTGDTGEDDIPDSITIVATTAEDN